MCEPRRERAEREQPVAVTLNRREVRDHGNEDAHDGAEHCRFRDEQRPERVGLEEKQPAHPDRARRAAVDPAGDEGDRPEEAARLVVDQRKLVAANRARRLELSLEQQGQERGLLALAEEVLPRRQFELSAVASELFETLVCEVGQDGDPAQLARVQD